MASWSGRTADGGRRRSSVVWACVLLQKYFYQARLVEVCAMLVADEQVVGADAARERVSDRVEPEPISSVDDGPSPATECLTRVRRALPGLEGARRRVAEFVLAAGWEACGLPIGELAERSGTSENAVSRFTRAVGYSGYRAFSQALSVDLGRTLGASHSHPVEALQAGALDQGHLIDVIKLVFRFELECLRDTMANLGEPQLQRAVTALVEARRVLLIGTGAAAAICQLAQYRLSNIGVPAAWASDPMVMVSEVSQLGANDVLIGVAYSGRTRVTVELLEYARRRRHATTIALTAARNTPLATCADIPLVVFGPNVSVGSGQFSARVSGMVLLEALVTAVALKRSGDVMAGLEEFGELQARINNLSPRWKPDKQRW